MVLRVSRPAKRKPQSSDDGDRRIFLATPRWDGVVSSNSNAIRMF